jgi:hypothetical protein
MIWKMSKNSIHWKLYQKRPWQHCTLLHSCYNLNFDGDPIPFPTMKTGELNHAPESSINVRHNSISFAKHLRPVSLAAQISVQCDTK